MMTQPIKVGQHAVPADKAQDLAARLIALASRMRANYDTSPVSKHEWDVAVGDDAITVDRA